MKQNRRFLYLYLSLYPVSVTHFPLQGTLKAFPAVLGLDSQAANMYQSAVAGDAV